MGGWVDFASLRLCAFALERVADRHELADEEPTRSDSEKTSAFICVICGFSWAWCPWCLGGENTSSHTQKASTKKQKPKTNNPNASLTNSKKPRVFISNGCDMSLSPFLRNFGFRISDFGFFTRPIHDFSYLVWEDGAKSPFAQRENGERLAEICEADTLTE